MKFYYDDINTITIETSQETGYLYFQDQVIDIAKQKHIQTEPLAFGKNYYVHDEFARSYLVAHRFITKTKWFQEQFDASDIKLGALVEKDQTCFRLWAPTAVEVKLILDQEMYSMTRKELGIFEISLHKNYHKKPYYYEVSVNGKINKTCDPYALASGPNRSHSVVCDISTFKDRVQTLEAIKDPLILEVHTRDFTMDPKVDFKNRGKLLGLIESVDEFGFTHIQTMNIDTVQLMPLHDFASVDEKDQFRKYNWGYDPMQYFALEGSYSSNIDDPLQVMHDLRKVVSTYHENNLHVTLDVVFNHVYEVEHSSFHKTVPYYYFRYDENNNLSNGSFCGNELATEMPMARKLIVTSCQFFTEFYKIDGFRFDLMGLMDRKTLSAIQKHCPSAFLYGEGWNMECGLDKNDRANMNNAQLLHDVAFFNDDIRDKIAGSLDGHEQGMLSDDIKIDTLDDNFKGTRKLFTHAKQSINYIECHDNLSLADRMKIQNCNEKEALFLTQVMILSSGIPLLQIGQSFYRDKKGVANSYQSGDDVNHISWKKLTDNKKMHQIINETLSFKINNYEVKDTQYLDDKNVILIYDKDRVHINKLDKEINLL